MSTLPELSIVIPAYNEEAAIAGTVRSWAAEADRLHIPHELIVIDDGSTDRTGSVLEALAAQVPSLRVRHHANRGHGPTILDGYQQATGTWVLQVDSDDEVGTGPFEGFWRARNDHDVLIGRRRGRTLSLSRRLLSAAARGVVRLLFGRTLADVNSPYRLMRRSVLAVLLTHVPSDTFAPNVAISGLALGRGLRVTEIDVPCRPQTGRPAPGWGAMGAGMRSLVQLLSIASRAQSG